MLLDGIAQRYSVLPSQLLNMSVNELNWNIKIYSIAVEKEYVEREKRKRELRNR